MINYIKRIVDGEPVVMEIDTDTLTDSQYETLFPLLWADTVERFCRFHGISYTDIVLRQTARKRKKK